MNLQHLTRKIGKLVLISLLLFAASMVLSDIYAPFTTNAYLQKHIVSITTEIEGNVRNIFVNNGDYVEAGEPLFEIDKHDLVEDRGIAYANMVIIQQHLSNLEIEISQIEEKIKQHNEVVSNKKQHYLRYKTLRQKKTISQEQYDDAHLAYLDAKEELEQSQLDLEAKKIQFGQDGENGGLMLAKALLNRADRKIEKAITFAPVSGWVTNMQLNIGETINNKSPQVAITSQDHTSLVANFNEKALGKIDDAKVLIVFDAIPGKVFTGKVRSKDSAVQFSEHADSDIGKEAYVHRDERWIRKSQQVRSVIEVDGVPTQLISGSKATAMIKPDGYGFWSAFSTLVMKIISCFHYIY